MRRELSGEGPVGTDAEARAAVEAVNVTKYFRVHGSGVRGLGAKVYVHAVDGLSLALYPDRVTALVGESGSGKSTVARVLAQLYRPTGGTIRVNGEPIRARRGGSLRKYASRVQLILQDPFGSLNPTHRVNYILSRPLRLHGRARTAAEGLVTYDFVGMAREECARANSPTPIIHFCGAASNVTAGKYNDGLSANREVLAARLGNGMALAVADAVQHRRPIVDSLWGWEVREVLLPAAEHLCDGRAELTFRDEPTPRHARQLAWANRCRRDDPVSLSCLNLAGVTVLHLPGEMYVEYQLAAQEMYPDDFVAVAAYGDFGPGDIGTAVAYSQGGYIVEPQSHVSPEAEDVVVATMRELLGDRAATGRLSSEITAGSPRLAS